MAHLLVIEGWYTGTGPALLRTIRRLGHRFTFVARDIGAYLDAPPPDGRHPLLDAANVLTFDTNDTPALLDFLERQHQTLHFDGVLTTCDFYLGQVARVAERLRLLAPSVVGMDTTRLKHRMRAALDGVGLPNPGWRVVLTQDAAAVAAAELGYPLIAKPVDLGSGRFVTLVRDAAELRRAVETIQAHRQNNRKQPRSGEILLEEYLPGEEVSVEAVTSYGETQIVGITDKSVTGAPAFVESGHMFPAALDEATAASVAALTRRALAAVGYVHGVSHTEVKLTPAGPRIVEINPRQAGNSITELIQQVTGIDLLAVAVRLALGQPTDAWPSQTGVTSAAIQFLLAPRAGCVAEVFGRDDVANDPAVVAWEVGPLEGRDVRPPQANEYLGHVIAVDRAGLGARALAERALGRLRLRFDDDRPDQQSCEAGRASRDQIGAAR